MVSAVVALAIAGILVSIFLASGGAVITKQAFAEVKKLTKDAFDALGTKEDTEKSTGSDRPVEDQ